MDFKALSNPITLSGDENTKPSFFRKIRGPLSNFSPKMKKVTAAGLVVFLVFALVLGVYITRKPTQLAPQASLTSVDISLKPDTIPTAVNQEFSVDVSIDTGQSNFQVSAVQAKVNYDPAKLELKTVTLKDYLPVALMQPQNVSGSTKFVVGSNPSEPKTGSGIIASITFKALATSGSTQITFDDATTQIAAVGHDSNVAGNKNASTVNFGSTASTQPSSSPSSNPSPSVSTTPETSFTLSGPSSVTPNQEFAVNVYSRSDIDSANLWNAKISFPKDLVQVVRFDKTGSFVTNWAEEYFNNTTGEISLTGGVTNPGIKTTLANQLMTTIVFKAKTTLGTANINLLNLSTIYRNSDSSKITPIKRNTSVTISSTSSPAPTSSPLQCQVGSINSCPTGYICRVTTCNGGSCDTGSGVCEPTNSSSPTPCPPIPVCPTGQHLVPGNPQDNICPPWTCVNNSSPTPSGTPAKGDGNNDGKVDLQDLSIMFSKWSPAINIISHFQLDFNDDLRINSLDYSAMRDLLKSLGVIRG